MYLTRALRLESIVVLLFLAAPLRAQVPQSDPDIQAQPLPQDVLDLLLHRPATKPLAELVAPDRLSAARRLDGPLAQLASAALDAPLAPLDVREFLIDARVRYGTVYFVRDNAPVVDITVIGDAARAEADLRAIPGVVVSAAASTDAFTVISAVVPPDKLLDAASVADVRAVSASGAANGQGFLAGDPDAQKTPEELARAAEPLPTWPNDWMNDAWVPDEEAELLALIEPGAPTPRSQGAANNQAEQMLDIDQARLVYGATAVDGTGIDVGTLSDSVNRRNAIAADGFVGVDESQNTGDLPPDARILVLLDNSPSTTDEGRAMMEHIFDIVPAVARLGFSTASGGEAVFANGITNLGANGMDIINDDVVYLAEPYYQDGVVAQAVITYVNGGGIYFALNHNYGDLSREDLWSDTDADNWHAYDDVNNELLSCTIAGNATVNFGLQWSQPWGSATTDLRLEIWSGGVLLASSTEDNDVTGIPRDSLNFTNASGAAQNVGIAVRRIDGSAAGLTFKFICFDNGINNVTFNGFANLAAGTLTPHAGVAQSIAVGAAPYFNRNTIEPYSGRGPHRRFFNSAGNPSAATYTKPDITGVDGCNTTFFPNFAAANDIEPDGFPNFFGTSAATPNVAAIGAMMLEIAGGPGSLTQNNVRDILAVTAVDLGTAGHDRVWGYGRAQALGAVAAARGREVTEYALYPNQFGQDSLVGNLFAVTDRDTVIYSSDSSGPVTLTVAESHATMDPMVLVHNETSRVPVACDYDSGPGDDALLTHAGSFWVVYAAKVLSQADFTTPPAGDFTISIDGPDVGLAPVVTINAATWSGTLNGVLDDNGDLDYYSVTVPAGIPPNLRRMIVTNTPTGHDGMVHVYDPAGTLLGIGDGLGNDVPDTITIENVSPGQLFVISIKSWLYQAGGDFTLQVQFAPDNDLCADAQAMPVGSTRFGATDAATFDAAPFCGTSNTAPGVWYSITGTGRTITVTTCNPGTDYDTKVTVYCNDCGVLTCIAGNDDQFGPFDPDCDVLGIGFNRGSTLSFCSQAGAQYLILVHGFLAAVGDFELSVFSDGPPCAGAVECGGEPIGACCAPTDCTGSGTCESSLPPRCGGSFFCLCFDSADGDVICADGSVTCGSLVPCPGGSADCPGGQVCITDESCCGTPVCIPPCPTAPDFGRGLDDAVLSGDDPILAALDPELLADWPNQTRGLTGDCFETTQGTCDVVGGSYAGDGVACDSFSCCETPDVPHDPAPPHGAGNVDPDNTVLRWNPDAGQLYGVDSDADRFLVYNPLTGAAAFLGSTASGPIAPAALAWTGSTMYTIDLGTGAIYSLDLLTGRPQFVTTTGVTGWQGLAADPTDNAQLYAIGFGGNDLYRVNLDGSIALVGNVNLGGGGLIASLTFDGQGRLWTINFTNGSIGIIDKDTAATTVVAVTPLLSVQGLDFDSAGNLWAHSAVTDTLYRINLFTGVATPVGPDGTIFVKGIAFAGYPGVPPLPALLSAPVMPGAEPMDESIIPTADGLIDPATVVPTGATLSQSMPVAPLQSDVPAGYVVQNGALVREADALTMPAPAPAAAPRGFFPGVFFIDFDDVAAPDVFALTTRLTTAYAELGVVFEGPGGNNGGAILNQSGGFGVSGHSAPNFLAFNAGSMLSDGGIPTDPETLRFGRPMNYVNVRAGSNSGAGQSLTMTGFDSRGNFVDQATITLASNLQDVTITGPGIVEVVISSPANVFVLDDLLVAPCTEYYQVLLDTVNPPSTGACSLTPTPFCDPGPLFPFTTYYWQVLAGNCCDFNTGPVWSFTTGSGCPGSGDCCEAHNGDVGCEDPECCERVCAIDSYCCTTAWDSICADEAAELCAICGAGCPCADFNGDNLVNLVDFVTFQVCFDAVGPNVDCPADVFACGDLNADGRINLVDFVTFQTIFFLTPDGITPPDCLSID